MDLDEIKGRMAASVRMVMERALAASAKLNQTTTNPLYQTSTANQTSMNEATQRLISNLVFAESKSVRTSTIILASFNVLAAFATAASILYDCYWASKRCNPKFKASKFCVSSIHPAETFPLVVSIGIVIQGIVFAGVQGQGLQSLFTNGCSEIAQFMWPALFIVPYIQFVFGLECTFRSLRSIPFRARGKYDVTICCGVVVLMLIATWIPSHVFPEPDVCFASLVWFITRFGEWGFVILATATGAMVLSALTIFYRLSTVNLIDQHQRIAASRMVYYLVVGIVSLAFVLPYFFSLIYGEGDIKLAMMATVVLNLSGLMSGLLQLFLRSNTATTSFGGPKTARPWDRSKHEIRIFGPNELAMHVQMANPITGPRSPQTTIVDLLSRSTSRASLIGPEKGINISMDSLQSPISPQRHEEMRPMTPIPEPSSPPKTVTPTRGHAHKPSYSLFPVDSAGPKSPQQPISIYDITDLEPPPPIYQSRGIRHKRDSSIASSATVQIGLRISHAPAPQPPSQEDIDSLPLPSTTYNAKSASAAAPTMLSPSPLQPTTYSASKTPISRSVLPSSPLRVNTSFSSPLREAAPTQETPPALALRSPRRPSPLVTSSPTGASSDTPNRNPAVNKTLPPTPKAFLPLRESNTQLSPAVYSPEKKIPVPLSVSRGPLSATLPKRNPLGANPVGSPLARSNSGAQLALTGRTRSPSESTTKADWI